MFPVPEEGIGSELEEYQRPSMIKRTILVLLDTFAWTGLEIIIFLSIPCSDISSVNDFCGQFGDARSKCVPLEVPLFGIGFALVTRLFLDYLWYKMTPKNERRSAVYDDD